MNQDNSKNEVNISSIATGMMAIYPSKKSLVYGLHTLLIDFEAHLESILNQYKIMTSTMLLATMAAVGFSFSEMLERLLVNKLLVAGIIPLVGAVAIMALWSQDTQIYNRFWGAFFIEGVRMERKYDFLESIGENVVSLGTIETQINGEGNFYIMLNSILLLVSGCSFFLLINSYSGKLLVAFFTVFSIFFFGKKMHDTSKHLSIVIKKMLQADSPLSE